MWYARRFLRWTVFLGLLWAGAVIVFLYVRNSPRVTITGVADLGTMALLSPDGSRLITIPGSEWTCAPGPWRVWDTKTGELLHDLFPGQSVGWLEKSPDRKLLAVWLGDAKNPDDNELWLVDWSAGRKWRLDIKRPNAIAFKFSSTGRWLFAHAFSPGPVLGRGVVAERVVVVDVASKQVAVSLHDFPRSSNDDRRLFVQEIDPNRIEIWEPDSGKKLATLTPAALEPTMPAITSPDDQVLLSWEHLPDGIDVWDLETGKKRFRTRRHPGGPTPVFTRDSRILALGLQSQGAQTDLEIIDLENGRVLWTFCDPLGIDGGFSPDGSLCYVVHGRVDQKLLSMFEVATGRLLWEKPSYSLVSFAGQSGLLLSQGDASKPLEALEPRTGERVARGPSDFDYKSALVRATPDGRAVAVVGWESRKRDPYFWEEWLANRWPEVFGDLRQTVLVLETATGREIFRAHRRGNVHHCALSDDAGTLMIVYLWEGVDAGNPLQCSFAVAVWEVSPTRAYLWAIGVAICSGVVLLALRRAWRKLTLRSASVQQTASPSASP